MFYNSGNGKVKIGNSDMHYVVFGKGKKNLIIILGLGEGFKTVKGKALLISAFYKEFAKDFKVYVFGRKDILEENCTIRDMAGDLNIAMDRLGIGKSYIVGISMGGMIAQYMAIDYPDRVEKLVIGVSAGRQNDTLRTNVEKWIEDAQKHDYEAIVSDNMIKSYTEKTYRKYKPMLPLVKRVAKPKSFDRFIIQAKASLKHDAYEELGLIKCPVLVIGGDSDKITGKNSSEEMAEKIKDCKMVIYKGLGHGAYEETKDFGKQIIEFLKENQ